MSPERRMKDFLESAFPADCRTIICKLDVLGFPLRNCATKFWASLQQKLQPIKIYSALVKIVVIGWKIFSRSDVCTIARRYDSRKWNGLSYRWLFGRTYLLDIFVHYFIFRLKWIRYLGKLDCMYYNEAYKLNIHNVI